MQILAAYRRWDATLKRAPPVLSYAGNCRCSRRSTSYFIHGGDDECPNIALAIETLRAVTEGLLVNHLQIPGPAYANDA